MFECGKIIEKTNLQLSSFFQSAHGLVMGWTLTWLSIHFQIVVSFPILYTCEQSYTAFIYTSNYVDGTFKHESSWPHFFRFKNYSHYLLWSKQSHRK